jgi:hypothetical protein
MRDQPNETNQVNPNGVVGGDHLHEGVDEEAEHEERGERLVHI